MKKIIKNEQGFTLIEIIAVLIILGILTAVAVPKYLDLMEEARNKSVEGAIAAAASDVTMRYSSFLMKNGGNVADAISSCVVTDREIGDFTYTADNPTSTTIDITVSGKTIKDATADKTKTLTFSD